MRIHKLTLHNFRNFSERSFEFPSLFTVVIGENGKGKSSLLQGMRLAAGTFLLGLDEAERLHIQKEDVRRIATERQFAPQPNCFFRAEGEVSDKPFIWQRTLSRLGGRTDTKDASDIIEEAGRLNSEVNVSLNENTDLPVICFFSTARLWVESKQTINLKKKGSIIKDGYVRCLDMRHDRASALAWVKSNYYKNLKDGRDGGLLEAVLNAISTCVPDWTPEEWDEDYDDLAGTYVTEEGVESYVPLYYLSDGLRTMAHMAAEIAYRCAILNGHHGKEAVINSKGIVLIDEIDMHLHPNWQRTVIHDLKKAFPHIQFVVTTHSPFIVQSAKAEELINLDTFTDANPPQLSLEEVATEIMQVEDIHSVSYEETYKQAEAYFKTLNEGSKKFMTPEESTQYNKKLDEIEKNIEDPAYAAFLKLNRLAKQKK
ncbi:AAA family ATPase [Roseivirga sp. BDSF3-8]|uniref:AAA family ATPase n=1 Tax=Roseivirga sp. BDSF3-8 TaxID=3241598 RepID=UPI003531ADFE